MMKKFCTDPIYDYEEAMLYMRPSFCLINVAQMIPCILLWLLAPLQIYVCSRAPIQAFNWTRIFIIRVLFVNITIISILIEVLYSGYEATLGEDKGLVSFISPIFIMMTLMMSIYIFFCERKAHQCSSLLNFTFYFFYIIVMVFIIVADLSSLKQQDVQPSWIRSFSYWIRLISSIIIFILVCFRDIDNFALETEEYACGMERASALSKVTFSWLSSFMYSTNKQELSMENSFSLRPKDRCADNYENFRYYWENFQSNVSGGASLRRLTFTKRMSNRKLSKYNKPSTFEISRPPLLRILCHVIGHYIMIAWFLKFIMLMIDFADPLVLYLLIDYVNNQNIPLWNGSFYAVVYLILRLVSTACEHQSMFYSLIAGMRSKSMLIAAIYRKVLRMNNDARSQATEGDVANLISVEVQRICEIQESLWVLISTFITAMICIPFLWQVMGRSVLSGISFLFLLVPACGYLIFFLQHIEEKEAMHRDERLSLLNEVFNGISFLKLHAWETPYEVKITRLRTKELKSTRKVNLFSSSIEMLWTSAPFLVMFATVNAFLSQAKDDLTAQRIFVSYSLINILRTPISEVPWAISNIIDATVSLKRITDFFMASDLDLYAKQTFPKAQDRPAILIERATFAWFTHGQDILREIDLKISPGRLVAVFGKIGNGKSSLLSAILGEMRKVSGYVCTRGNFAYVTQDPWIQQMTVTDNILFGSEMDRGWYDKVLEACALKPDLKMLDLGDSTLIGEGGATLTAGQKQRITLARAVYKSADIYLLDEPLSAIDVLVANSVFQQVIGRTGILKKHTRIIATSQLHFLPLVDFILVIRDGRILERGAYEDLMTRPGSLLKQYVAEQKRITRVDSIEDELSSEDATTSVKDQFTAPFRLSRRSTVFSKVRTLSYVSEFNVMRMENVSGEKTQTTPRSIIRSIYKARGYWFSALVFGLCALGTCFNMAANVILSTWADDRREYDNANKTSSKEDLKQFNQNHLHLYACFGLLEIAFFFGYNVVDAYSSTRASDLLHGEMLNRLMRAPMCVFYMTPIGRIMNRFSGDIDIVDHELPTNINEMTEHLFFIISIISIICYVIPYFLVVVAILMFIYFRIELFYAPVARQSRRLDFVTRSNLFTMFTETVVGAPVIRAFGNMDRLSDISDELTDDNARFYFTKIVCDRWLGVRLDLMAALFVFMVMSLTVFSRHSMSAGYVGLCISYALQITDLLDCLIKQFSEVVAGTVAVERVTEFSEIEQEKSDDDCIYRNPGAEWPSRGKINFRKVFGRERHGLNPVLRGATAEIEAGEHIGVVGRTGTGKSALTRALFALMELDSGSIDIDNVDIRTVPLKLLRSRLTILPQDPILFSGTLRHNLDPLSQYEEDELWRVLRLVSLDTRVQAHPRKLKLEIAERGSNLSIGERQLICIARTLLRKSQVLVLDEATAHLDSETSRLVIQIFREVFKTSTIIIITHDLGNIIDTDRVLVLDRGRVREFDTPSNLLKNPFGFFYIMAKHSGKSMPNNGFESDFYV